MLDNKKEQKKRLITRKYPAEFRTKMFCTFFLFPLVTDIFPHGQIPQFCKLSIFQV